MSSKVAIIAAMEREVKPAIKDWTVADREHDGRTYRFFETERAVLVCGGIGADAARRATEAVIALYQPALVVSIGFAGATEPGLKVGDSFTPRRVVDATDGSVTETGVGNGALVTIASVADVTRKAELAKSYSAQAVDMEAASVARSARARKLRFAAFKAISDESGFVMPPMDAFVSPDGRLSTMRFLAFILLRPQLWPKLRRLAHNSSQATQTLCRWLEQYNPAKGEVGTDPSSLHPMTKA